MNDAKTKADAGQRRQRRAVRAEDALYARLPQFKRAVARSLRIIEKAMAIARPWSISFSGGKDSTCLLALVREIAPDTVAVFVDSGAEYPETLEFVNATANVIHEAPAMSIIEMYREVGLFGSDAVQENMHWAEGKIKETMIQEPMRRINQEYGFEGNFTGIRAEESVRRAQLINAHPPVWKSSQGWRCEPLRDWTYQDVWAFIASREQLVGMDTESELSYCEVYDILARIGVERKQWRVSPFAGATGLGRGRWATLKQGWPDLFNRFAAEFKDARLFV